MGYTAITLTTPSLIEGGPGLKGVPFSHPE